MFIKQLLFAILIFNFSAQAAKPFVVSLKEQKIIKEKKLAVSY